jgi:hypothetical protein
MSDNVKILNNDTSLDRFINDKKIYIKQFRLKIEQCGAK